MENTSPKLVDTSFKNYMSITLQKCHNTKVTLYNNLLNICVFTTFIVITGIILLYCYKKKMTPEEEQQRILREQEYILQKIRFYQNDKKNIPVSDITDLPIAGNDSLFNYVKQ